MEDVLDLYAELDDPAYPTVCLDEKLVVLHEQTCAPLLPKPGAIERRDYEYVRLMVDNLNTHVPAALHGAFPPLCARAILEHLEFHYTPKYGSWLNMAEIEISAFERGCLWHPVGDLPTLERRASALEAERNANYATIHWQFTSQHVRTRLADLYLAIENQLN